MDALRIVTFLVFGVLAIGVHSAPGMSPKEVQNLLERISPAEPDFVPGEVIVKMKPSRDLDRKARSIMGIEETGRRISGGETLFRLPPSTTRSLKPTEIRARTLTVITQLKERSDVEYVQPNWIKRIAKTANDPRYSEQWHYFNNGTGPGESPGGINLPMAWDVTTGSENVVVAVLDTGVLPDHPDISGSPNLIPGFDMISDSFMANDGDGRESDPTDPGDAVVQNECFSGSGARQNSWHGTHVAGTVGVGRTDNGVGIAGGNWKVKAQAVRVLGRCGGTTADIIDGIRWAAGLDVPGVAKNEHPARVINMSLSGGPGTPCTADPATQAAINDAVANGAVVIVAAGNDAVDASQVSPASCDNVITVAASDYRGHLVTRYSNFGETIEIMAPGGDVNRDDNGDSKPDGVLSMFKGGYEFYNGTSMAAPHVTAVVALYLAEDPSLMPAQIFERLQQEALPRDASLCPEPCGAGLLSAAKGDDIDNSNGTKELPVFPPFPPPIKGSIDNPGEKNLFKFTVIEIGRYKIETAGKTDVVMSLFGPNDQTTFIIEDDDGGEGRNAKIRETLEPGTYFVEIRHYFPSEIGAYTITVQIQN